MADLRGKPYAPTPTITGDRARDPPEIIVTGASSVTVGTWWVADGYPTGPVGAGVRAVPSLGAGLPSDRDARPGRTRTL